jgi:hypothetical protein
MNIPKVFLPRIKYMKIQRYSYLELNTRISPKYSYLELNTQISQRYSYLELNTRISQRYPYVELKTNTSMEILLLMYVNGNCDKVNVKGKFVSALNEK